MGRTSQITKVYSYRCQLSNSNFFFFQNLSQSREVDSRISAKALGLLETAQSFQFYFLLSTIIEIFGHIELLNAQLQKSELCVNESHEKVKTVTNIIKVMRVVATFDRIWSDVSQKRKKIKF